MPIKRIIILGKSPTLYMANCTSRNYWNAPDRAPMKLQIFYSRLRRYLAVHEWRWVAHLWPEEQSRDKVWAVAPAVNSSNSLQTGQLDVTLPLQILQDIFLVKYLQGTLEIISSKAAGNSLLTFNTTLLDVRRYQVANVGWKNKMDICFPIIFSRLWISIVFRKTICFAGFWKIRVMLPPWPQKPGVH